MSHKRITSPYGRWINEHAELLIPDEAASALLPDLTAPALEAGPSTYTLDAIGSNAQQTSVASGEDAAASGTGIQPSIALTGGPGDDILTGTVDADSLDGAGGNDTLLGLGGADSLIGGSGNDSLDGGAGNDTLSGDTGADTLNGGTGADTINGGTGADIMNGGNGNDTYFVDDVGDTVTENVNQGLHDKVYASINYTLGTNVERLYLTGSASINGTGNLLNNYLRGNDSVNILDGGAGNDTLRGGAGADTMIGGDGNDEYYVDDASDVITESAAEGTDTVYASISYTLSDNVEWLFLTGSAAINGTGHSGKNYIYGNAAANILDGGAGNDYLNGGTGADTLIGGTGDDRYTVDDAADVVTENAAEGIDSVYASISYTLIDNVEWLFLTGSAAINGTGHSGNNHIYGNSAANILDGGAGDDYLNGGTGADTMIGGIGDDRYSVGDAGDVVIENANEGTDLVYARISYTLSSNVENLSLTGSAAINGTGNSLNNGITGNAAANILDGGAGNDYLSGGTGADQFVFSTALSAANADTISDFSIADGDILALDDAVMTQLAGIGSLVNHLRLSTQAAVGADDYVVYNTSTGDLYYDASGDGTGTLELIATLSNKPQNLTASQFIVI